MGSREKILQKIKANKPSLQPLPEIPEFISTTNDLLFLFISQVESGGGKALVVKSKEEFISTLQELGKIHKIVCSLVPELTGTINIDLISDAAELDVVDVAIFKGRFGVSENGAIWLQEEDLKHRVLPFITQHLVLTVSSSAIVENMHEAYRRIETNGNSYGVFIAGPSKTADIEQSLVIGAHGPKSLIVVIEDY